MQQGGGLEWNGRTISLYLTRQKRLKGKEGLWAPSYRNRIGTTLVRFGKFLGYSASALEFQKALEPINVKVPRMRAKDKAAFEARIMEMIEKHSKTALPRKPEERDKVAIDVTLAWLVKFGCRPVESAMVLDEKRSHWKTITPLRWRKHWEEDIDAILKAARAQDAVPGPSEQEPAAPPSSAGWAFSLAAGETKTRCAYHWLLPHSPSTQALGRLITRCRLQKVMKPPASGPKDGRERNCQYQRHRTAFLARAERRMKFHFRALKLPDHWTPKVWRQNAAVARAESAHWDLLQARAGTQLQHRPRSKVAAKYLTKRPTTYVRPLQYRDWEAGSESEAEAEGSHGTDD